MLKIDTKPDSAAIDAAARLSEVSQKDYLETDTALTWMRREHPEARLVTRCLSEGPITASIIQTGMKDGKPQYAIRDTPDANAALIDTRMAHYAAELTIDGEIVATGHGQECRAIFGAYVEKAESIAIRRCLIHAGYSLEVLRQLGYELRIEGNPPRAGRPAPNRQAHERPAPRVVPAAPAPAGAPAHPTTDQQRDAPAAPKEHSGAGRPTVLSGELGDPQDINTPVGVVQLIAASDRKTWRREIDDTFAGNTSHGPLNFEAALAILGEKAGDQLWRWLILLQAALDSKELNRIMSAAKAVAGVKNLGAVWSKACGEKAQTVASAAA